MQVPWANSGNGSGFQAEPARIAEVPVIEAVEKPKTGDPIETRRACRHASDPQIAIEVQGWNLDTSHVHGERTGIGAAKSDWVGRDSAAEETVCLLQKEFKTGAGPPGSSIGDDLTDQGLSSEFGRENDLDDRSMVEQWP
jgi:hypothetical protein